MAENANQAGSGPAVKVKDLMRDTRRSAFRKYRDVCYGDVGLWRVIKAEVLTLCVGGMPGAAGLFLRSKLYRGLFRKAGRSLVIGRNVTLRHAHKISLGDNVVLDDNCVLDAKGDTNRGIVIEDNVFIGRNTIIYCKNGDINIGRNVNISSNCQIMSSNRLTIGADTVVAAFCYFLSGGEYDFMDTARKFSEQSGMVTHGELRIGCNCWIGAGVLVLDAACIGDHCVVGAGAVVTKPIPRDSLAVGVPARVLRQLPASP